VVVSDITHWSAEQRSRIPSGKNRERWYHCIGSLRGQKRPVPKEKACLPMFKEGRVTVSVDCPE
jgi:hypothetical protein